MKKLFWHFFITISTDILKNNCEKEKIISGKSNNFSIRLEPCTEPTTTDTSQNLISAYQIHRCRRHQHNIIKMKLCINHD